MPGNQNGNMENKVEQTARRLRTIRVELADEGPQAQCDYLSEEIQRAIKGLSPEERTQFLQSLKNRFPLPRDLQFSLEPSTQTVPNNVQADQFRLDDPDVLADRLLQAIALLDQDQREAILGRFRMNISHEKSDSAGIDVTGGERLNSLLSLNNNQSAPNPADMGRLLEILVEFIVKIESLIWKTWSQLAPRSGIRASAKLADIMREMLNPDSQICEKNMEEEIRRFQQLIAAMVSAPKRAGEDFTTKYMETYSAAAISKIIELEPKSLWESEKVRCWKKYEKLSAAMDIEADIKTAIVNYVTTFMNVGRRS